jgi:hypothetical protein
MAARSFAFALALATASACGGDNSPPAGPLGGSLDVAGRVVDFESGNALTSAASVSTVGLLPSPKITVEGAEFVIEGVPEYSAFQILASSAPTHRPTYSPAIEVTTAGRDDVTAYAVSETFLAGLATGFGVTPSAARGVLLLRLIDANGNPKADVARSNIVLAGIGDASAPSFLDANMAPDTAATTSSASGWVVIFEVPPGVVSLGVAANATATLEMASSPVGAAAVTIASAVVTDGAPMPLPTNVSFSQTVFPIFQDRGCVGCHSGSGPGRDLGGLQLNGGANLVHRELTVENPLRARTDEPELSLVLTMPSAEDPPDRHPNITFTGPQDPDYIKILVWLREGAKNN